MISKRTIQNEISRLNKAVNSGAIKDPRDISGASGAIFALAWAIKHGDVTRLSKILGVDNDHNSGQSIVRLRSRLARQK